MENKLLQWLKGNKSKDEKKALTNNQASVNQIQLVQGIFGPAESAEVLLSLLNYKIKFHSVQLLNLKETDSITLLHSQNRINELKEAKKEVTRLLVNAKNNGEKLEIISTVEINILK